MYHRKEEIKKKITQGIKEIEDAQQMIMSEDLKHMRRVMRRLNLTDKNDLAILKGRVSTAVSAADEVLCTELLTQSVFADLNPAQTAALCSCLVYTEGKSDGKTSKDPTLFKAFELL